MSEFINSSILRTFKSGEFSHLDKKDIEKIVRLIAHVSEDSYRRGYQQGCYVGLETPSSDTEMIKKSVTSWRFSKSINISNDVPQRNRKITSIERLKEQNILSKLATIGLSFNHG